MEEKMNQAKIIDTLYAAKRFITKRSNEHDGFARKCAECGCLVLNISDMSQHNDDCAFAGLFRRIDNALKEFDPAPPPAGAER